MRQERESEYREKSVEVNIKYISEDISLHKKIY